MIDECICLPTFEEMTTRQIVYHYHKGREPKSNVVFEMLGIVHRDSDELMIWEQLMDPAKERIEKNVSIAELELMVRMLDGEVEVPSGESARRYWINRLVPEYCLKRKLESGWPDSETLAEYEYSQTTGRNPL